MNLYNQAVDNVAALQESMSEARDELRAMKARLDGVGTLQQQIADLTIAVEAMTNAEPALRAFRGWSSHEIDELKEFIKSRAMVA